mmetsp:Transcript_86223/g.155311  ORF Transcript_86223/g.155311 Transcript_86223/m.155311 type:complete len:432 (-) Transcript_86223:557-1852(-)
MAAAKVIQDVVESAPFPLIANDWQSCEITCLAMNDHYVQDKECPRHMLLSQNSGFLDPSQFTSLPASVRLGIRAAMAYGHAFDAHFESVKSAAPCKKIMKTISMRTVVLDGQRFVICSQHKMGDKKSYGPPDLDWWARIEQLVAGKAKDAGLTEHWIRKEESSLWCGVLDGIFEQTDHLCRKEQLDQALIKAMSALPFPFLLCDPFLPDCPVICLNEAAQALTGWGEVRAGVAQADVKLLEGAPGPTHGAYHVNYGRYKAGEEEEEAERLAVRATCANGRPCAAKFRQMHELSGDTPCSIWFQGCSMAQGVKGPLSGTTVWYLIGLLSPEPDPVQWSRGASCTKDMASCRSAFEKVLSRPETWQGAESNEPPPSEPASHEGPAPSPTLTSEAPSEPPSGPPRRASEKSLSELESRGGDVKLLSCPLWHSAA